MKNKLKPFPMIRQAGMMECGTTSLAMVFKYYGYYDIRRFLSEQAEVNLEGTDLYTLSQLAQRFGFEADGYQMSYDDLFQIRMPFIAHYEGNHFVVIYKATPKRVWIADPASGKYQLIRKEFEEKWNGIGLVLEPTAEIFKHNELTELVEATRKRDKSIIKKFYLSSIQASKKVILGIIGGSILTHFLSLSVPLQVQALIDHVLVNRNVKLLYAILISLLVFFASNILLKHGRNLILTQLRANFERSFFSGFFRHMVRIRQTYFDRHKREDFINRFQENIKIRESLAPAVIEGLLDFVFSFIYLGVILYYNVTLGLIAAGTLILFALISTYMNPRLMRLNEQSFEQNAKSMGFFIDTLLGIQTTKLLGIEMLKYHKWRNQYTKALNKEQETVRQYILYMSLFTVLLGVGQIMIYWYGAYLIFNDQLSVGAYIAIAAIYMRVMVYIAEIYKLEFQFVRLSVSFKKINDVLVQPVEADDTGRKNLPGGPIGVTFDQVRFNYLKNQSAPTLEDVSLDIAPGQFVGIVGRNGSGKSTLIKLICRLYSEYEGSIRLNGLDLLQVREQSLRKRIAVIPQDIYIFDGTIRENIQAGNLNATDEQILDAIECADFMEYLKSQYLGLNQRIGENGVKLSGGEQLKLAFARLFVANPELIILDEASSALDVETEQRIMQKVRERFNGKTIISVAHRLHTLKDADQLFVLDKGRIVENGTHMELMKNKGLYHQFINTYISF